MCKKLLIRLKPFQEEALGSYIHRIVIENCCKIGWIINCNKYDIDKIYEELNSCNDNEILSNIAQLTDIQIKDINRMLLARFYYTKSENIHSPLFLYENSKFCPMCLKEHNYQRIYWQLRFINICIKHNTILLERCVCGKDITPTHIINGQCDCGKRLSEIPVKLNKYRLVFENQLRLYDAFNILEQPKYKGYDYINKENTQFGRKKFLCLVELLEKLSNFETISLGQYMHFYCADTYYFPQASKSFIIEYVLNNWPNNFFNYLDMINSKITILFSCDIFSDAYLSTSINPLYCILRLNNYEFIKEFRNELMEYLIRSFNSFFKKIFNGENFISIADTCKYFCFPHSQIYKMFETTSSNKMTCIDLNCLLSLMDKFISKSNLLDKKDGYICLYDLYTYFQDSNFLLRDEIDILLNNNIDIRIDIYSNGLSMICVPEDESKRLISKELGI
jgi:hypothetical protein